LASIRERDGIWRSLKRPWWRPQETGKINVRRVFLYAAIIWFEIVLRSDVYVLSNICISLDSKMYLYESTCYSKSIITTVNFGHDQSAILCRTN
jgi:hypothetical protein